MDVTSEKSVSAIHYRRSVRVLQRRLMMKSKECIHLATLAPTSIICSYGSFTISHQMKFCPNLAELALIRVQQKQLTNGCSVF
jgi:hypothetical protein